MSLASALLVALGFLLGPWLLMPPRGDREIRGFVRILWILNAFYCHFWHRLEVRGVDTLPRTGPAILISNHTCCIDHMLLQAATGRLLGFMIAKELYDYWLFTRLCATAGCIPVKRDGRDLAAMRSALRALGEGRVLPIFPEGRIYPTSGRELGPGKQGVAYLALKAEVPVVPAYISGTPPTNQIVPSYCWPSRAKVQFGAPLDLSDLREETPETGDRLQAATERLMDALRALRQNVLAETPASEHPKPHRVAEPRRG
ncbi:MAG: lysophospholipid acyltransferase family protein [Isosphaeraceae bacterium]